ncbi:fluoride efflux transporter FluC [Mobiluncus curtisii]|nr:CrcB family protein [Mobiluncus curtisii]
MPATPKDLSALNATITVFIGGALGAMLRWGGSLAAHSVATSPTCRGMCQSIVGGGGVNIDTWILNLLSVLVLAYLTGRLVSNPHRRRSQALKLLIGTGFCGGLGTYGGPVWQIVVYQQFHLSHLLELLAMFAVSLPLGLFALWLGTRRAFVSGDDGRLT